MKTKVTKEEQQEIYEGMSKIVKSGMKTIEELGIAFGRVARAMYRNKFFTTKQEINKRIKAFKEKEN